MMDTYIIAEIGINHNGDIELAKTLIDKAKESDCNAVKSSLNPATWCIISCFLTSKDPTSN